MRCWGRGWPPRHRGTREVAGAAVIDSREVKEGLLFVAFAGEKVNGNSYLLQSCHGPYGPRLQLHSPPGLIPL